MGVGGATCCGRSGRRRSWCNRPRVSGWGDSRRQKRWHTPRGAWWRQCGGCGSNGRYEAGEFPGRVQGHGRTLVEWEGKGESVILTRRRGDAETSAEKRRSQEKTSAETAEDGGLRCGADALFGEQLAEKQWGSQDRGGMGGERRECDFDAEARRRGDKRGEAEKRRSQEKTSAETAEDGGLRCGAGALFGEQLAEKQWGSQDRGGMGGEPRECDFDAEARRRGDKRGEAAKSREDERGDSGGWWPSVRSGRAFRRATSGEAGGKSKPERPSSDTLIVP